jgi:TatD DNase family protein
LFINIHSHYPAVQNEFVLQSLYVHFELTDKEGKYSVGLHPWYINALSYPTAFAALKKYAAHKNILAIGECGLDKVCTVDFALQQQLFTAQILLANQLQKPLIIHCVRAYEEVQQLLQQQHNTMPVIFHGFNKDAILGQQLISKGYHLSIGKALLQPAMQEVLRGLPIDKIFFETDDAAISIQSVYHTAADTLQIDINSLSLQIQKNAAAVFGSALF